MISNNVNSPAFRAQQAQQQVAFRGTDKHHFQGVASAIIPGSGQVLNGDVKEGFKHLGILGAALSVPLVVSKINPTSKAGQFIGAVAFVGAGIAAVANQVYSSIGAFTSKSNTPEE